VITRQEADELRYQVTELVMGNISMRDMSVHIDSMTYPVPKTGPLEIGERVRLTADMRDPDGLVLVPLGATGELREFNHDLWHVDFSESGWTAFALVHPDYLERA